MGIANFFRRIFGKKREQGPFEFVIQDTDIVVKSTRYLINAESREEAFKKLVTNYYGVGPYEDPDIKTHQSSQNYDTITRTEGMPWWFGEVTKVNGKPEAYDHLNRYMRENNIETY